MYMYIDIWVDVYMKYHFLLSGYSTDYISFQGQDSYLFCLNYFSLSDTRGDTLVLMLFVEGFCPFQTELFVCRSHIKWKSEAIILTSEKL